MREKLLEWYNNNPPGETLIFKDGLWSQIEIVNNVIPGILGRSYEEFLGIREQNHVISTHTSKSVLLPVFELNWNKYTFMMRYNFYDWKVSVTTPYNTDLDCDFMDLFDYTNKISCIYCEGFSKDWVFGPYSESKQKFTCEISDEKRLFTFFWIIKYNVLNKC